MWGCGRYVRSIKTDAILKADGGGKVTTAINPIYSADRIIRLFFGIAQRLTEEYTVDFKMVNGIPGVIVTINNKVTYVLSFAFEDEKISNIYMMVNPEKLMHLNVKYKKRISSEMRFYYFLTFQEVHLFASYLKFNFPVFFINTCNNRYSNH